MYVYIYICIYTHILHIRVSIYIYIYIKPTGKGAVAWSQRPEDGSLLGSASSETFVCCAGDPL